MTPYLDLMARALDDGVPTADRTGVGTRLVFGHQTRFDLSAGFPLLTAKKLRRRSIIVELPCFLRGDTNVRWLQERQEKRRVHAVGTPLRGPISSVAAQGVGAW